MANIILTNYIRQKEKMKMCCESSDRVRWIDIAKGIGIPETTYIGKRYIYSFHMHLFFFLSGYLFSINKYASLIKFLSVKFKTLVVPYFCFGLISYFYWLIIKENINNTEINQVKMVISLILSQGADNYLPYNPVLWFLTCLFVVESLFFYLSEIKNNTYMVISLLVCAVSGFLLSVYIKSYIPWSADAALTGIVFYGLGYICKKKAFLTNLKITVLYYIISILSIILMYFIIPNNGIVSLAYNLLGENIIYTYIAALAGIYLCLSLSICIKTNKVLEYIGKNALIIMAIHWLVKIEVIHYHSMFHNITETYLRGSFILSSIDTVVTVLIIIPLIYLINNYFPFIIGRFKRM